MGVENAERVSSENGGRMKTYPTDVSYYRAYE